MVTRKISGKSRYELAVATLRDGVDAFVANNQVFGLKQFAENQQSLTVLPLGQHAREDVLAAIDRLRPTTTGTPLARAIRDSVIELRDSDFEQRSIVCLTDGENNVEPPSMAEAVALALTNGVHLSTDPKILIVGFGPFNKNTVETYEALVQRTDGAFLVLPEKASAQEAAINASIAIELAVQKTTAGESKAIALLTKKMRLLEERLEARARRSFGGRTLSGASLLLAIFVGAMIVLLGIRVQDRMTEINAKLESFAEDLNKLWKIGGGR